MNLLINNEKLRIMPRPTAELWQEGMGEKRYEGNKWGGRYLRAPNSLLRALTENPKLKQIASICRVDGYIHDNNTGPNYEKVLFVKSVRDIESILIKSDSPGVHLYGVKSTESSRNCAPILFPRTLGERHVVVWNPDGILGKEFYKIIPHKPPFEVVVAQLNSTLAICESELFGSAGLGGGGLKFSADSVKQMLILDIAEFDNAQLQTLLGSFDRLSRRPMRSTFEELGFTLCRMKHQHPEHPYEQVQPDILTLEQVREASPDRYELDRVIFDILGFTDPERLAIYQVTLQLVKERALRSKNNQP